MIFREQPTDPWTDYDYALLEAYQTIKDETCQQCGNPIWLCRSSSNTFKFTVKTDVCRATKALEDYKNLKKKPSERAKSEDKRDWGKFFYTTPTLLPFEDTMPNRKEFYEEKARLVD